jgi:hypothetical protein
MASINELAILSNLENSNAKLIKDGKSKEERLKILKVEAGEQRQVLDKIDFLRSIKKTKDSIFIDEKTNNIIKKDTDE